MPKLPPTVGKKRTQSQINYAQEQTGLSLAWRAAGRPGTYTDWVKSDAGRATRTRLRAERNQLLVPLAVRRRLDTSPSSGDPSESDRAGSSRDAQRAGDRPTSTEPPSPLPGDLPNLGDFDFSTAFSRTPAMEVDREPPTVPSARTGAGGVGARGGGSAAAESIISLNRSRSDTACGVQFSKSRVMFAYAFAHTKVNRTAIADNLTDFHCTSMSFVPVDFLPFYLSPAEFSSLPPGARVEQVSCQIRVLGVRSAFDVGTTLSGVATSEYVPILHTAVGLNHKFHLKNMSYSTSTDSPMVPSDVEDFSAKKTTDKYYVEAACAVTGVPRSNSNYAVLVTNKNEASTKSDFQQFDGGLPRLDRHVDTYLLNSTVGQTIVDYSYTPNAGFITAPRSIAIPLERTGDSHLPRSGINKWSLSYKAAEGWTLKPGSNESMTVSPKADNYNYYQTIEQYGVYSPHSGPLGANNPQPQVHIGMSAIPQLSVGTDYKSFVNACVYYAVDCQISVTFDAQTDWTAKIYQRERNALFYTHTSKKYNQPDEVLGFWDGAGGSLDQPLTDDNDVMWDEDADFVETVRKHRLDSKKDNR